MVKYLEEVENGVNDMEEVTMVRINELIRKMADKYLKTKYKKRIDINEKEEPPWMNEEIIKGIAKRRRLNKIHRHSREEEQKERAWIAFREQKE